MYIVIIDCIPITAGTIIDAIVIIIIIWRRNQCIIKDIRAAGRSKLDPVFIKTSYIIVWNIQLTAVVYLDTDIINIQWITWNYGIFRAVSLDYAMPAMASAAVL